VATLAALQDRRFHPVRAEELGDLEYEISVLSPLRRVRDIQEIQIGQHGLIVRSGGHEGLLLPQVASEEKWDRNTFLKEVCYKAGLPPREWQNPDADLFRFTALVFGERKRVEALLPLDLFRKPAAWPVSQAPCSQWPTAGRLEKAEYRNEPRAEQNRAQAGACQVKRVECSEVAVH